MIKIGRGLINQIDHHHHLRWTKSAPLRQFLLLALLKSLVFWMHTDVTALFVPHGHDKNRRQDQTPPATLH